MTFVIEAMRPGWRSIPQARLTPSYAAAKAKKPANHGQMQLLRLIRMIYARVSVLAVRSGETCRSVAKRFGVSVASVVKWSQRYRVTGSVSPDKMGGYRRPLLDPHRDFIIEQIERTPHLTLYALKDLLAARGIAVSHQTVWEFLRRQGLSFKKNAVRP